MASLLQQFELQYSSDTAEITSRIGRLELIEPGERGDAVRQIERQLVEVAELLDQMELSVREMAAGGAERNKYELRLASFRGDKKQLDGELRKALQRLGAADAAELFGGDDALVGEDHRAQLIANTERLDRTTRKLQESYRMCVETEQIGADVLGNLENQRATLGHARDQLRATEQEIGQSSKILSGMIRRAIQNRLLMLVVGLLMLIVFLFIMYLSLT